MLTSAFNTYSKCHFTFRVSFSAPITIKIHHLGLRLADLTPFRGGNVTWCGVIGHLGFILEVDGRG